jgi:hypothetical protein
MSRIFAVLLRVEWCRSMPRAVPYIRRTTRARTISEVLQGYEHSLQARRHSRYLDELTKTITAKKVVPDETLDRKTSRGS